MTCTSIHVQVSLPSCHLNHPYTPKTKQMHAFFLLILFLLKMCPLVPLWTFSISSNTAWSNIVRFEQCEIAETCYSFLYLQATGCRCFSVQCSLRCLLSPVGSLSRAGMRQSPLGSAWVWVFVLLNVFVYLCERLVHVCAVAQLPPTGGAYWKKGEREREREWVRERQTEGVRRLPSHGWLVTEALVLRSARLH